MKLARSRDMQPELANDLARAVVKAVGSDGLIVVSDEAGAEISCELLIVAGLRASFEPGDRVLVWRATADAHGVILGRLGRLDGEAAADAPAELVLQARKRLIVHCAEGSVELRSDGKVLIKGRDIVSRAQRTNRIKGGSVAIN